MRTLRKALSIGLIGLTSILGSSSKPSIDKKFQISHNIISEEESTYRSVKTWRELKKDLDPEKYQEEFDKESSMVKFWDFPVEDWVSYVWDKNNDWKPDTIEVKPSEAYLGVLKDMYEREIVNRERLYGKDYDKNVIFEDTPLKDWKIEIITEDEYKSRIRVFLPHKEKLYLVRRAHEIFVQEIAVRRTYKLVY